MTKKSNTARQPRVVLAVAAVAFLLAFRMLTGGKTEQPDKSADSQTGRAAEQQTHRAREEESRQLEDAVRQDADKVRAEPEPLLLIDRGEHAEQQCVCAERKRAERQKGDEPVEH